MTCGAQENPKTGITTHKKTCIYAGRQTKSPLHDEDNVQLEIVDEKVTET